jgi:dihydrofolate synthase/folylpolyglutamate synthase
LTSYTETLTFLYGLQYRGMKLGLRNVRALLETAGNPERRFPSIHLAGTNGKGSTASFIASIFSASGYRTGLYTSPHLVRFTERIRIDGKEIPERRLVRYIESIRDAIETVNATFFEATTCAAYLYFADERVDMAVIETGLGGRLDATNVVVPCVSVITNVALDHQEYLGSTIKAIAGEKGGIIKSGIPTVTGSVDPVALRTLRRIADKRSAPFFAAGEVVTMECESERDGTVNAEYRTRHLSVGMLRPGLPGEHQIGNARLAVAAVELLLRRKAGRRRFRAITGASVRRGLIEVRKQTGLQGRMQTLRRGGTTIIDVAHNPEGMRTLVTALQQRGIADVVTVLGVMKDKDCQGILQELRGVAGLVITVAANTDRALRSDLLYHQAMRMGLRALDGGSVRDGLRLAHRYDPILVTGSHYVVGEALQLMTKRRRRA